MQCVFLAVDVGNHLGHATSEIDCRVGVITSLVSIFYFELPSHIGSYDGSDQTHHNQMEFSPHDLGAM